MKTLVTRIPFLGKFMQHAYWGVVNKMKGSARFQSSKDYWEGRYRFGGNSGAGSYGKFADFKAKFLNNFVSDRSVSSVIEFGCGDGNQLLLANYPSYIGFDVSDVAIDQCRKLFSADKTKTFRRMQDFQEESASLTLSLDVIYHLVEDDVFDSYMRVLFKSAKQFVIIYSSNYDGEQLSKAPHVRHRCFTRWIESEMSEWHLLQHVPNPYPYRGDHIEGSIADFFVYARNGR